MTLPLDARKDLIPVETVYKEDGSHLSEPEPADAPPIVKPSKPKEEPPPPQEEQEAPEEGAEVPEEQEATETEATTEEAPVDKPENDNAKATEVEETEKAKKEESEKSKQLSKGFAKLAKEEARLRQREQQVRSAVEQIRAAQTQLEQEREQKRNADAEYRRNPQKLLRDYGFTLESANKYVLNHGKLDPADEVSQLRAELEREREAQKAREAQRAREQEEYNRRAAEQQRTSAHQQAIDAVTEIGKQSGAQFPLLARVFSKSPAHAESLAQQAVDMFEGHYNKHGRTLDINAIFNHIENELATFADVYASNQTPPQAPAPSPPVQTAPGNSKAPSVKKPPSTLTNDIAHDRVGKKKLTPEEQFKADEEEALRMPIWRK